MIIPQVLDGKNGHSYEVDTWSIGVVLYTCLVGKPPFETVSCFPASSITLHAKLFPFLHHQWMMSPRVSRVHRSGKQANLTWTCYAQADVKSTYKLIKANTYSFPDRIHISDCAKSLIRRILRTEPELRPTIDELLQDEFFQVPLHQNCRNP